MRKINKYVDQEIISGVKNNNEKIIKYLYNSNKDYGFFVLKKKYSNITTELYDDIYQESFIALLDVLRKEDFTLTCKLSVFHITLIKNNYLKYIEKGKNKLFFNSCDISIFDTPSEEVMVFKENTTNNILKNEIQLLPLHKSKLLIDFYYNGKSYEDIRSEGDKRCNVTIRVDKSHSLKLLKKSIKTKYTKEFLYEHI